MLNPIVSARVWSGLHAMTAAIKGAINNREALRVRENRGEAFTVGVFVFTGLFEQTVTGLSIAIITSLIGLTTACSLTTGDAAYIFFKAVLILCKREAGARSTLQLLVIER